MKSHGLTHAGPKRERNEDRFLIQEYEGKRLLLAVADGMGGHAAGDRAAQIACRSLQAFDANSDKIEEQLTQLIGQANSTILDAAQRDTSLEGMGTTLTALFVQDNMAYWIHAGDSRLYFLRNNLLVQISDDHSYPGMLVKNGELSAEEARLHPLRNLLLNCLGRPDLVLDGGTLALENGDLVLLSTDGLHDWLPQETIAEILDKQLQLAEKLERLLLTALAAGGRDDVTMVAAQL